MNDEEEKEKVALDGSSGEEDPAAAVKIVPVVEGDTGKVVKLEEEPVASSDVQSDVQSGEQSGVQSDAELVVPEPKVESESDRVE